MIRAALKPEHLKEDLSAQNLEVLRRKWLAERLANLREPLSDNDRLLAARMLGEERKPVTSSVHAKPGADTKKAASEAEQYAMYLWDRLHVDARKHGRSRWNASQRGEAAKHIVKLVTSAYPQQRLTHERLFDLADRPRSLQRKFLPHFKMLADSAGFGFVGTIGLDALRKELRAKPRI